MITKRDLWVLLTLDVGENVVLKAEDVLHLFSEQLLDGPLFKPEITERGKAVIEGVLRGGLEANEEYDNPKNYPDYEPCARCGYDHEYESEEAQAAHAACALCQKEIQEGRIGDGPDHSCQEEEK